MKKNRTYIYLFGILMICGLIAATNSRLETRQNHILCTKNITNRTIEFLCANGSTMDDLNVYDLNDTLVDSIEYIRVIGFGVRGPLRSIPRNICRFKQLKDLDLSNNQISNVMFYFTSPCLSQLEILDLSNNFINEIPIDWISQMPNLISIKLSHNYISSISNNTFYNISNIQILDMSSNRLTTLELWLIQIKDLIDYSNNQITHFSNNYQVDLSKYQGNSTAAILLNNITTKINFDDGILEMYNRCGEINSTYSQLLMRAIKRIDDVNPQLLNWNCSCQYYYLQKYLVSMRFNHSFSTWKCSLEQNITYEEQCQYQSSFNVENIKPRLCRIEDWELCQELDCSGNFSDLEKLSTEMYNQLMITNLSNMKMISKFVDRINRFNNKLNELTISQPITESIRMKLVNIVLKIENLLESIHSEVNITLDSIAILSVKRTRLIYSFSQIKTINLSMSYSIETNNENLTTTITIDQLSIENLSVTSIYTFYYLPSSLFHHAQQDQSKIIVSPIVGLHLPNQSTRFINMSFTHIEHQSGTYTCEFWQAGQWNNTGCYYSKCFQSNRHYCICNHTTSFALLFIPDKSIHAAYIPSITIAILSILCFCVSIILSIHRQATSFRHLSIANIFTLINSIILFILLTVILIRGYKSSKNTDKCSISEQNLAIVTYFFLLSTFASKTLLGICYFLTIFFHFIFIQLTSLSNKWFYISFFLLILIAIIPTIIIRILINHWADLFRQYEGICWLNTSNIFRFISIPILIFIGMNLLIIIAITVRLFQFYLARKMSQTSEKRMTISIMIWLSLCISLGIAWIVGPFLNIITTDKNQSSSVIIQWIFGLFSGLEGVWVLIMNVIFYCNQKINTKSRQMILNKIKKTEL